MPSKRMKEAYGAFDKMRVHSLQEALDLVVSLGKEKFDASIDVALKTGLDPRKSDQIIRGFLDLPAGLGKPCSVMVFAKANLAKEAKDAGADYVGDEELVNQIFEKQMKVDQIDRCIATPDMMPLVGKIGRILGPKGLVPNAKFGTVTVEVAKAVGAAKKGQLEYRLDKNAIIHGSLGRARFSREDLLQNAHSFFASIWKVKPSAAKGEFFRKCFLSSTMGPGVEVDLAEIMDLVQGKK